MLDVRQEYQKTEDEVLDIDVPFFIVPPGADKIESVSISAIKWPRRQPDNISEDSVILTEAGAEVVGRWDRKVRFRVQGGTDDYDYQISVLATWDTDAVLQKDIFVKVRNS